MDALDYIDAFCEALYYEQNKSKHTIRAYRGDLKDATDWAQQEGSDIWELDHFEWRAYLADLTDKGLSARTINRKLSSIRTFLTWISRQGVEAASSIDLIESPKLARVLPRALAQSEVLRLFEQADIADPEGMRDALMLELLYASGCRIAELAGLTVVDVHFGKKEVRLFGKGQKERIVPLHDKAVELTKAYLETARMELISKAPEKRTAEKRIAGKELTALFISITGRPMSADMLRKRFTLLVQRAGLDAGCTPHTMRHTFATDILDGGADLRSVQELLGHKNLSTTQIYTHLSIDKTKRAILQSHPRA